MHLTKGLRETHIAAAVQMTQDTFDLLSKQLLSHLTEGVEASVLQNVRTTLNAAKSCIHRVFDVSRVCQELTPHAVLPFHRPISSTEAQDRKRFCFFSLTSLLVDTLQNDTVARQHIMQVSFTLQRLFASTIPSKRIPTSPALRCPK